VQGVGQGKDHQPACDHQNRVQAVGQVDPVDHLQHQPATCQPDCAADTELTQQIEQQAPVQTGFAAGQHVDQGHGEEHRHRVVAAGFDLEAGRNPLVQALATQQREHRRRIGRADNGADQQALDQVEVEQPGGHQAGEPGGDHHPHRG